MPRVTRMLVPTDFTRDLVRWSETLAGIARTGLGFTDNLYERERFAEVLHVAGMGAGLGSNDIGIDRGGLLGSRLVVFERNGPASVQYTRMNTDGSGERILTEGFHNESPSWAPNGQYIMFFRDPGGHVWEIAQ